MDSKEFLKIRHFLGKTQKQWADLLCVSTKAIQSYDQGWRPIPVHLERQTLLWELNLKNLCWFLTGTFCEGKIQKNWGEKIKMCKNCDVFKQLFIDI